MGSSGAGPLAGKRIGLLSAWAGSANGGVFEAVIAQCEILRLLGAVPVVLAIDDGAGQDARMRLGATELRLVGPAGPKPLAFSPDLPRQLHEAQLDLLHLHGIWQYPTHAAAAWARRTRRSLVISPHGMLDPWITSRGRWKKQVARVLWEERSWNAASLFHALTQAEAGDIAAEAEGKPVCVIPNAAPPVAAGEAGSARRDLLYLGRIHPKKNTLALVEAWMLARPLLPRDARLFLAGWGGATDVAELEQAVAHADDSVRFLGPAYGEQKAQLLAQARFMALPSQSEGLPMAILEAWSAGLPTIMTEACHLPEGFQSGASLQCSTNPEAIAEALVAAYRMNEAEWQVMSRAALGLASGAFSRQAIASQWADVYGKFMRDTGNG